MRKLFLLFVIPILITSLGFTQGEQDFDKVLDRVEYAFEKGDTRTLSTLIANPVEIAMPGTNGVLSKAQAIHVIESFFEGHPPLHFQIEQRFENQGHGYAMGKYRDAKAGNTYQFSIRLRKEGRQIVIGSLYIKR